MDEAYAIHYKQNIHLGKSWLFTITILYLWLFNSHIEIHMLIYFKALISRLIWERDSQFDELSMFDLQSSHFSLINGNENGILILFCAAFIIVLTH